MHLAKALCGAVILAGCATTQHQASTTTTTSAAMRQEVEPVGIRHEGEPVAPRESIPTAAAPAPAAKQDRDAFPDAYRGYAPTNQRDEAREAAENAIRTFRKPTAYALVVRGLSCWLSATVGDAYDAAWVASGESGNSARAKRCGELAGLVYGDIETAMGAYRMLRIPDPTTAQAFEAKVRQLGEGEGAARRVALTALARSVAHTANEQLNVKTGIAIVNWGNDKAMATRLLENHYELSSLFAIDAGALTPTARTAGLLYAMDRVDVTRNLPARYQVLALGGPFEDLFGIRAPRVPADDTLSFSQHEFESWFSGAARNAYHSVPRGVAGADAVRLARAGVLCGLVDQLRVVAPKVEPPLDDLALAAMNDFGDACH